MAVEVNSQSISALVTIESISVTASVALCYKPVDASFKSISTFSTIYLIPTTSRVTPVFTTIDTFQTRHFVDDPPPRIPDDE